MVSFRERTRFASVVAVGLALLVSGVVTGAAGGNFILGQANSAGTSNTSLTTSSTGNALLVTQNGTGTAIRGSTGSGSGIAGFFTSGSGSGVSGVVANENKYGIYAANDSATGGTGAALRVQGGINRGLIATSTGEAAITAYGPDSAIIATSNGCTGFCFGGNGVTSTGTGTFGAGTSGSGFYGVFGQGTYGTYGGADAAGEIGAYGSNYAGTGVYGAGAGAVSIGGCGAPTGNQWACSGGRFSGNNGIVAMTGTQSGVGVLAQNTYGSGELGLYVYNSSARVDGNFSIGGTCTGCTLAFVAANAGSSALRQGDAVTLVGSKASPLGTGLVLTVRAAKSGDTILGIMQAALEPSPETVTIPASSSVITVPGVGEKTVGTPKHTEKAQARIFQDAGTTAAKGAYLRVVQSGIVEIAAANAGSAGIKAGDALALDADGKLARKAEKDRTIGYALKGLDSGNGKISILLIGN
jgi:hypothetical protein